MIEILGYWSVKHGEICSWLSVSGIFQFAFVCFWLTSYPSYSIHTLWMFPYSHCLIFWFNGMEQHITSTVFLCSLARLEKLPAWNACLFPPSLEEDLSSHQLVERFRTTTVDAELNWTPTARLSSAIFFDGWPRTALPYLDNVSKILQRSIHTKLDRL